MNRDERRAAERGKKPKNVDRERMEQLAQPGTPQHVTDVRAKSERHGKSTADKWNQ